MGLWLLGPHESYENKLYTALFPEPHIRSIPLNLIP
jgi:hypothetical protein